MTGRAAGYRHLLDESGFAGAQDGLGPVNHDPSIRPSARSRYPASAACVPMSSVAATSAAASRTSAVNAATAAPPAVSPATLTSVGPHRRSDRVGARNGGAIRLRSLPVKYLRYHSRHGLRKGVTAAFISPFRAGGLR